MRSSRLTLSALAAVLALTPTLSLGAQQKRLISQAALIAIVENHKGAVLRYIDAAPDSMLGFRPTKGVRNFAEQIVIDMASFPGDKSAHQPVFQHEHPRGAELCLGSGVQPSRYGRFSRGPGCLR